MIVIDCLQAGGQILVGSFVNAGPAFFLLARLIPVLYRCTKVFIFKVAGRSFQNSSIAKRYKSSIQKLKIAHGVGSYNKNPLLQPLRLTRNRAAQGKQPLKWPCKTGGSWASRLPRSLTLPRNDPGGIIQHTGKAHHRSLLTRRASEQDTDEAKRCLRSVSDEFFSRRVRREAQESRRPR